MTNPISDFFLSIGFSNVTEKDKFEVNCINNYLFVQVNKQNGNIQSGTFFIDEATNAIIPYKIKDFDIEKRNKLIMSLRALGMSSASISKHINLSIFIVQRTWE